MAFTILLNDHRVVSQGMLNLTGRDGGGLTTYLITLVEAGITRQYSGARPEE